jgi:hypothetical protein
MQMYLCFPSPAVAGFSMRYSTSTSTLGIGESGEVSCKLDRLLTTILAYCSFISLLLWRNMAGWMLQKYQREKFCGLIFFILKNRVGIGVASFHVVFLSSSLMKSDISVRHYFILTVPRINADDVTPSYGLFFACRAENMNSILQSST